MKSQHAIAVGAVVQAVAIAVYVAIVPAIGQPIVLFGLVGGVCGAVLTGLQKGLWAEGAAAAVAGGCLFLLGFLTWGGFQAVTVGGRVGARLFGVYIGTVVTQAIMLLTPFAIEGLLMGVVVGWLRRSAPVETGSEILRNVTRR